MTEEAQDHSFGRYLTAKKAAATYGLLEHFEHERSFAMASSNSAAWGKNFAIVEPSEVYVEAIPVRYPSVSGVRPGAGKTYVFISRYTKGSDKFGNPLEITPTTIISSSARENLFTIGQSGNMATQQPPTTEDESVEQIIWQVATTLPIRYRARLASRLSELQIAVQEEELDGRGISVGSLKHFIGFLSDYPTLRCPVVSATPDGNIYASWKSGSDNVFSINFFPDGKVRFVIFRSNNKHPGESIRLSGTATVDVVISIAEPHGVLTWASDEGSISSRL